MTAPNLNQMLEELDHRQQIISSLAILANEERERCDAIVKILDDATRPPPVVNHAPIRSPIGACGFEYRGRFCRCYSRIGIYLGVLRLLMADFPDKRMGIAIALRGRDRLYLAQNKNELFRGKSQQWVEQNSEAVGAGWYADTNTNSLTKMAKIRGAIVAAGLTPGEDVKITWRNT